MERGGIYHGSMDKSGPSLKRNSSQLCYGGSLEEQGGIGGQGDPGMMQMLNSYYSIVEVSVLAVHIPGCLNVGADAISRDNLQVFHMQVLKAHARSSPVCQALMGLLVHQQPDWTSQWHNE